MGVVKYRKALDARNGCEGCGHLIGLMIESGYQCEYCGYEKKRRQAYNPEKRCLCWISRDVCEVHGRPHI